MGGLSCNWRCSSAWGSVRLVAALLIVGLAATPAFAGQATNSAALAAHATREGHCPDVGALDVTKAAASVAQVATVWQQVSEAYEAEGIGYILYWRGVLAQCLGYEDKAAADLSVFVRADGDRAEFVEMARDAERRLVFLGREPGPAPSPVPLVLGIGFLAGGGVLGGLTVSQGVQVAANNEAFVSQPHNAEGRQALLQEREPLVIATNGLLAGTVASLTASVVSFAIHLGTREKTWRPTGSASRTPVVPPVTVGIGPTSQGGWSMSLGGRW